MIGNPLEFPLFPQIMLNARNCPHPTTQRLMECGRKMMILALERSAIQVHPIPRPTAISATNETIQSMGTKLEHLF